MAEAEGTCRGEVPTHFTFGAYGRLLSNTVHPAAYDPAEA